MRIGRPLSWLVGGIIFLVLACLSPQASKAQVSGVTGVVTDSTGAAVPEVDVNLSSILTGAEYKTKTNELGVYLFSKIPPGVGYTLTFSKDKFRSLTLTGVSLGVGITETHNVQLEVGTISETVEVVGTAGTTLNTTDATIGNVLSTERIRELPVQIRNSPAALLGLEPGVVANTGGGTNRDGSVTGARTDQGNITIDGIDANDQATGQAFATVGNAPIDAIQEFRTVSAIPGSGEGRSSGGQIELVTKSGTNKWHGSLREFHRNTLTAANTFFNNKSGVAKPALIRNQFGGNLGGPIVKNKLFFFFDYEGRRDASQVSNLRTVPLDHFRNGGLAYINNTAGCTASSRLTTTPNCITILTPAQVAALDPQGVGADAALLSFVNGRYPEPNDLSAGDGINTGGFRFNSPVHRVDNTYTARVDYQPTNSQKLFVRWNIARRTQTDTVNSVAAQFPGDPETAQILVKDYAYVIGHTWTISSNKINQATFGVSRSGLEFPTLFKPSFPNSYAFTSAANPFISNPFAGISSQTRFVPVPTIRDDFTYVHGTHNIQFGGSVKPIQQKSSLTNDFNFVTVGLGGLTNALNSSLRPSDILASSTARALWDRAFTFDLGRFASIGTNFNYSVDGQPFAPGTGKKRNFRYNEFEFYAQDSWRARSDLTITYGVRWQYYGAPYEANGFQAVSDVTLKNLFAIRQANAAAGIGGPTAEPLLRYDLGGKANNGPDYFQPDLNNWGPRFSLAYNPSFKNGWMSKLFGDRKTVVRLGGAVVYDRVGGAITFIQDQVSYLFDNSATTNFGAANPVTALQNDPRFTALGTLPVNNVAPTITRPFTPFVDSNGFPIGNQTGEFNYTVDPNFRTPYAYTLSFGIQRQLPANFQLEVDYVGRLGRKLFAQADAAQIVDFKDAGSGQSLTGAFNALQAEIHDGAATFTQQPWFENQINAGIANFFGPGVNCTSFGVPDCTSLVGDFFGSLVDVGDLSDTIQALNGNGLLLPNVGLSGQFSTNIYNSSMAFSNYNGLLVSLRKNYSRNLEMDFNYTFSHSIDNQSSVVNTVAGGLICDLRNLRVCRGNSDFDVQHIISTNWVYDAPFGHGHYLGRNAPGWLNQIIGGWQAAGIWSWRTGFAFGTTTNSFPVGFNFNSPGVFVGNSSALATNIHTDGTSASSPIQFFKDPTAAVAAFINPAGGQIGNRNDLRGPGFWNVDLAVLKNFKMPWSESHRLQFRWESYNLFNHTTFVEPSVNINSSTFGRITATRGDARQMQFALRYDF